MVKRDEIAGVPGLAGKSQAEESGLERPLAPNNIIETIWSKHGIANIYDQALFSIAQAGKAQGNLPGLLIEQASAAVFVAKKELPVWQEKIAKEEKLSDKEKLEVNALIRQLGADRKSNPQEIYNQSFREREKAQQALEKLGPKVIPLLEQAITVVGQDAEVAQRCQRIIDGFLVDNRLIFDEGKALEPAGANPLGNILQDTQSMDDSKARLAQNLETARKFADNPALTAERIGVIEQLQAMYLAGKIKLSAEQYKSLEKEINDLKNIKSVCAGLEIDSAFQCACDGNREGVKEHFLKAIYQDKKAALSNQRLYSSIIGVDLDLAEDPESQSFMKEFQDWGGDMKKVGAVRKNYVRFDSQIGPIAGRIFEALRPLNLGPVVPAAPAAPGGGGDGGQRPPGGEAPGRAPQPPADGTQ